MSGRFEAVCESAFFLLPERLRKSSGTIIIQTLGLLFVYPDTNLLINNGDGVPLITAWAGLMTPADSNVRWVMMREARRRFFLLSQRVNGLFECEHS